MRISENLYILNGCFYRVEGNVYGIKHKDGLIIVDCGTNLEAINMIEKNMKYYGLDQLKITDVLITHSHFDHSGNAHYYKSKGAKIYAHLSDALGIESGDNRVIPYNYKDEFIPCEVDVKFESDTTFKIGDYTINVIHTPGHSNGSVFYEINIDDKNVLFIGDFISPRSKAHGTSLDLCGKLGIDYDEDIYLSSLFKAANLNPDFVLPAHGIPILNDAKEILKQALAKALVTLR